MQSVALSITAIDGPTRVGLRAGMVMLLVIPSVFAQSTPSAAADTTAGALEEVVVTAERHESTVQRSSVSLQVVSPADLTRAGVIQPQDLTTVVPGLQLSQSGPLTQSYIRGVGDSAGNPTTVSPVAWNIDGVYVARTESVGASLFDIERLEVLRGPQGTLYGRNASGGAINVLTRRPTLGAYDGYVNVEVGNFGLGRVESALNVPLTEDFAMRAAVSAESRQGYLSDDTSDVHERAGRLRALWNPSDSATLLLTADAAHSGGRGAGFTYLPRRPGADAWEGTLSPPAQQYLLSYLPIMVPYVQAQQDADFWNVSAEYSQKIDNATLTVLPAFRYVDYDTTGHWGFVVGQRAKSKQTSLEVRLAAASAPLDWVAGLYYFREQEDAKTRVLASPLIQDIDIFFHPTTTSYAAFGQATASLTPSLRIIAGLRYTSDDRQEDGRTQDYARNMSRDFAGQKTFAKTTGKVGFEYDLRPKSMVYGTVSTGFKSGGINQEVPPNVYQPEELTAFELGTRNRFLDDRWQLNAEIFYWKYRDKQETTITLDNSFYVNLIVLNAGQATIKGASIDLVGRPWRDGTLRAFVEYNKAEYDEYVFSTVDSAYGVTFFDPRSTGCRVGNPTEGTPPGATFRSIDCSGFPLPRAPQWTGSLGYSHELMLSGGASVTLDAAGQYASSRYLWPNFIDSTHARAYTTVDLTGNYNAASGRWSAGLFVRNLSNAEVYQGGFVNPYIATLFAGTINPPRTYGARLSVSF